MNHFCENCDYLKDNKDLVDCCIHKKFCERAYSEGIKNSAVLADVHKLTPNAGDIFVIEVTDVYPAETTSKICQQISSIIDSTNCLFIPQKLCNISLPNLTAIKMSNKFYYKDDSYVLTAEDGTTFSDTVKTAISEICGESVAAYNEFLIIVRKLKDDYRESETN